MLASLWKLNKNFFAEEECHVSRGFIHVTGGCRAGTRLTRDSQEAEYNLGQGFWIEKKNNQWQEWMWRSSAHRGMCCKMLQARNISPYVTMSCMSNLLAYFSCLWLCTKTQNTFFDFKPRCLCFHILVPQLSTKDHPEVSNYMDLKSVFVMHLLSCWPADSVEMKALCVWQCRMLQVTLGFIYSKRHIFSAWIHEMVLHWGDRHLAEWWRPSTDCIASWSGLRCWCSAWELPIWWRAASCSFSAQAWE